MIQYKDALKLIKECVVPIDDIIVPIENSLGQFAASDVLSLLPNPPFCNSSVDGFAVKARDTQEAQGGRNVELKVSGLIGTGDLPASANNDSIQTAMEIMTGAPVPGGFDAVIKVEDVGVTRDEAGRSTEISVRRPIRVGENVRFTGEDFASNELLVRAGSRIMPEHTMAMASSGVMNIAVRRRPRIALLATGKEVVEQKSAKLGDLPLGKIYNSTSPFIVSALGMFGADVKFHGIVPDEKEPFRRAFESILAETPDIIITTGAVSVGLYDFIPGALEEAGAKVLFHRAAIRPGKPMLFAKYERPGRPIPIFGFPGNQISSVVGQRFFVQPYLRWAMGIPNEYTFKATMTMDFKKAQGLRTFCLGRLAIQKEGAKFTAWPRQMSFMLGPILHSNCWAVLEEDREIVKAGEEVECTWLYPGFYDYIG